MIADWLKFTTVCDPFQRFLARSFGKNIDVESEGVRIVAYQWRGVVYVISWHHEVHGK